ncbi:MAG: hypothetical protein NWQ19_06040, partial [Nonlabens sp.]|nr:hypothetical protein [Nonlabens sp.]
SDRLEILDYEIGFNLGKKYRTSGDNFVYIGATNPFQTGKVQTLNWKKTDSNNFPKLNGNDYINYDASWFEESSLANTYYATMGNYTYYIQEWTLGAYAQQRYLVVVDSVSNEIIHGSYQVDTESTYLLPLITSDKPMDNTNQWTGSLFKNRPPIIYGFVSNTFGCPDVLFLGYKEPPIAIKCDNRH